MESLLGTTLAWEPVQQEVCLALADNLACAAIAAQLRLSLSTVATCVRRIHEKLDTNKKLSVPVY